MSALLTSEIPVDDRLESIEPPIDFYDDDGDGDDDGDHSRWLTVATFWEPTEAHIARLKLESEEIDCMILDENLVATYWFWANAVGGIKLQVREADFSSACRALQGIGKSQHPPKPIHDENLSTTILAPLRNIFSSARKMFRLRF
jgi:hypothetical protein